MNTKTKFTRIVFALLLALSAIGFSTSAALADRPVKYELSIPVSDTLKNFCSFPVNIDSIYKITGTDFLDNNGVIIRSHWHMVAQDTFTANGKTLVGIPFSYNIELLWDGNNITSFIVNGVVEKVQLPGGGIFNPAGHTDLSATPYATFLTPDKGNPGNIDGFCAALAP